MNKTEIHRRAHSVIDRLAALETPGPHVDNPVQWRKAVRNRLRHQHWPTLTAALSDDHHQAVTALVTMLAGPTATQDPTAAMHAARTAEWERNARRARGEPPHCARCDDGNVYLDHDGNARPCNHQPDQEPTA